MKSLKKMFWAAVVAAIAPNLGFAQTTGSTGTTTGGTTTSGGTTGGSSGIGSSGLSGNYGGGTGNSASTGTAITIAPPSQVQTTNQMSSSNILGQYYANPMYQGRSGTAGSTTTSITNPGGFNTALYGSGGTGGTGGRGSTGGGGGGAAPSGIGGTGGFAGATGTTGAAGGTGRTGGTTGATGFGGATGAGGIGGTTGFGGATGGRTTGGLGGATGGLGGGGLGGAGGGLGGASQQNTGMISPRPIAYTATYKFPVATVTPLQQQGELRLLIDNSSQLVSAKNVLVQVENGGVVVLKGAVADEDEARLVEGMMRITPGVRNVVNELKFPKTP